MPTQPTEVTIPAARLLSKRETAALLGLSVGMVEKLMAQRDNPLPSYKLGARRMFREEQLEEWLKTCAV